MIGILSSNNVPVQVGDEVIYGDGSILTKCKVIKITTTGKGPEESSTGKDCRRVRRIHLEVLECGENTGWKGPRYPVGHKFSAKHGERMWVLNP